MKDRKLITGVLVGAVILVVAGIVSAGNPGFAYAQVGDPPTVTGITSVIDSGNRTRLYRTWSDGLTEMSRQPNGDPDFLLPWTVIAE